MTFLGTLPFSVTLHWYSHLLFWFIQGLLLFYLPVGTHSIHLGRYIILWLSLYYILTKIWLIIIFCYTFPSHYSIPWGVPSCHLFSLPIILFSYSHSNSSLHLTIVPNFILMTLPFDSMHYITDVYTILPFIWWYDSLTWVIYLHIVWLKFSHCLTCLLIPATFSAFHTGWCKFICWLFHSVSMLNDLFYTSGDAILPLILGHL